MANAPPDVYRNKFLADAMVNLNMIDTIGSGIRRMFTLQRNRSFPLPDYDLSDDRVEVRICGRIIDENYTKLLLANTDLTLIDVIALDKVQKKLPLDKAVLKKLRARGLVERTFPTLQARIVPFIRCLQKLASIAHQDGFAQH